jgi:hypothetical protein
LPDDADINEQGSRARLLIALGAALVLAAIVIGVAVLGGEDEAQTAAAADPACISAWNENPAAAAYGRHNFNFHRYDGALVTFLSSDAEVVAKGEDGRCAVIFPSEVLDSEPIAAGQILAGSRWEPISNLPGIELTRVAELQVDAAQAPNATLGMTGELTPR